MFFSFYSQRMKVLLLVCLYSPLYYPSMLHVLLFSGPKTFSAMSFGCHIALLNSPSLFNPNHHQAHIVYIPQSILYNYTYRYVLYPPFTSACLCLNYNFVICIDDVQFHCATSLTPMGPHISQMQNVSHTFGPYIFSSIFISMSTICLESPRVYIFFYNEHEQT